MKNKQYSDNAIALADSILKAVGSGLENYSMEKTRNAILDAAEKGIQEAGGEDNAHSGETHWVRSAAIFGDEIEDDRCFRDVKQAAAMLDRDAKANGKCVRFFNVKVTAFIGAK